MSSPLPIHVWFSFELENHRRYGSFLYELDPCVITHGMMFDFLHWSVPVGEISFSTDGIHCYPEKVKLDTEDELNEILRELKATDWMISDGDKTTFEQWDGEWL